jgi:hypothetical protein
MVVGCAGPDENGDTAAGTARALFTAVADGDGETSKL